MSQKPWEANRNGDPGQLRLEADKMDQAAIAHRLEAIRLRSMATQCDRKACQLDEAVRDYRKWAEATRKAALGKGA